jgi:hypothetical protein
VLSIRVFVRHALIDRCTCRKSGGRALKRKELCDHCEAVRTATEEDEEEEEVMTVK